MRNKAERIQARMRWWTRDGGGNSFFFLSAWAAIILASLFLMIWIWGFGTWAAFIYSPVTPTVSLVGLGVSIWYLTRYFTFDESQELLRAHGIDVQSPYPGHQPEGWIGP